jgi:ABC-2 type transport system permease protein
MATMTSAVGSQTRGAAVAFLAICWRDIFVIWRQLPAVLAQVLLQPLFFIFILGRILPDLGYTRPGYATSLVPGIVGLTAVMTGLQATAFPLVIDFSYTKEIEDRLLAPLSVAMVGVQKIAVAALRALVAAVIIFPTGALIIGSTLRLSTANIPLVIVFCVMAAVLGSAMGLTMGTWIDPSQINLLFAVIFTPLLFTGCAQYPWALLNRLEWFQVVTCFNPLTYASEGLRAALVPQMPHMEAWIAGLALAGFIAVFTFTGVKGFVRRAVD